MQPKILVLIINFLSLNFTSIEIEGERVSSNQNEHTKGVRGGGENSKTNKGEQGGREGQNLWILIERTFWMSSINPPFQGYPPFLAKFLVPPSDSIFGRSYPPLIRGEGGGGFQLCIVRKPTYCCFWFFVKCMDEIVQIFATNSDGIIVCKVM